MEKTRLLALFNPLSDVTWFPLALGVLDLVLVSYIAYKTIMLVKGTRAERMLYALVIILAVYLLARAFNLNTLYWVLNNFLGSAMLLFVILFQDDLRRGLMKVGFIKSISADSIEGGGTLAGEITQAASELSSRRIGALMVIEMGMNLEEYTENAIQIDSVVNHQLLISLFLPTSPLHDGAVIIRKSRISAAGAVLPLTFNPNLSSSLGTRHRAAIGLSERADAIVVVVSEENGVISLIKDGSINRNLEPAALSTALNELIKVKITKKEEKKEEGLTDKG